MEIAKLFVSLALESGEYVKGLTNVSGQTKAISGQINATMSGIKGSIKNVATGAVDFGKKFAGVMSSVATALLPIGAGLGAVALAAKKTWDTLNQGAQIETVTLRFGKLTEQIGTTADVMLGKLRQATQGMMSDTELMSSASQIMSLRLAENEDQVVRLATVAGTLGWDMQQVILTFANMSTMRLDALGLSVEEVTSKAKELEAQGLSAQEAFKEAVILAGEARLDVGGVSETERAMMQLETATKNAGDAFKAAFAKELADDIQDMAGNAMELGDGWKYAAEEAGRYSAAVTGIFMRPLAQSGLRRELEELGNQYKDLGGDMDAFEERWGRLINLGAKVPVEVLVAEIENLRLELYGLERGVQGSDEVMLSYQRTVEQVRPEFQGLAVDMDAFGTSTYDARHAVREFSDGLNDDTSPALTAAEQKFIDATNAMVLARYEGLEFGKAMGYVSEESRLAAEAVEAYNAAFQGVIQSGDYTKPLPGSDEPLVTPVHTVSSTMGGLTAEQSELVSRYRGEIEKLRTSVYNLTNGINTYGMDQEKVNERIADAQAEIAHYEALMAPLVGIVGETTTAHQGMAVNIKAAEQAIFDQLVQMGAAPELITAYGVAIGVMSQDQADAALAAALLQIKIGELAEEMNLAIKEGTKSVQEIVAEGRESLLEYAEELTATGENLPEALAEGVTGNEQVAIDAITETANEIIRAANATFEIHSPSQVFADIGDNLGVGLVEGFGANIAAAQSTLQSIGESVIAGVNRGIEAAKATLREMLSGVADLIPEWLRKFLGIASPAAELIPVGVAITEGIIEGIRVRAAGADDEIVDIIKEMLDSARTFVSAGAGFGQIFTNQAITPIQKQIQLLSEQADIMDMVFMQYASHLGLEWGADNFWIELHRMSRSGTAEQQYLAAQMLSLYDQRQDALQQMTAAQSELVKQEEKLLRLEQARADLDFLKQQYELIKLIQENNLDTSILDGLTTGVNADAEAWMNAMIEATQAMIAAVEDELGIHSPSRWAVGVMHNVFDTMAETAERDAQALRNSMSRALEVGLAPATTTPVTTAAQTVDNSRRSVNYGGIHIHGETRYRSPLDVLQEQLV